jgi:hypothetical protein
MAMDDLGLAATVDPLADPGAHGGDADDAFDVVVVCCPTSTAT